MKPFPTELFTVKGNPGALAATAALYGSWSMSLNACATEMGLSRPTWGGPERDLWDAILGGIYQNMLVASEIYGQAAAALTAFAAAVTDGQAQMALLRPPAEVTWYSLQAAEAALDGLNRSRDKDSSNPVAKGLWETEHATTQWVVTHAQTAWDDEVADAASIITTVNAAAADCARKLRGIPTPEQVLKAVWDGEISFWTGLGVSSALFVGGLADLARDHWEELLKALREGKYADALEFAKGLGKVLTGLGGVIGLFQLVDGLLKGDIWESADGGIAATLAVLCFIPYVNAIAAPLSVAWGGLELAASQIGEHLLNRQGYTAMGMICDLGRLEYGLKAIGLEGGVRLTGDLIQGDFTAGVDVVNGALQSGKDAVAGVATTLATGTSDVNETGAKVLNDVGDGDLGGALNDAKQGATKTANDITSGAQRTATQVLDDAATTVGDIGQNATQTLATAATDAKKTLDKAAGFASDWWHGIHR